jgi:hypoxanthine phosphoribosyltransferase
MPQTLFISHHHGDERIVASLSRTLQRCLGLAPDRVRCTSNPAEQLAPGTDIMSLMRESVEARAFVGVYSRCALRSPWVMAETGARLGVGKAVFPVVLGKEGMAGPIAGKAGVCLPDGLRRLVKSLAASLNRDGWREPSQAEEGELRDLINSEVKQWLVPVHFEARFPRTHELSADVVVATADRLRDLIGAGDFRPGLIVALNEGGMILAAGLARHCREAQIGSLFTAFTKRQKRHLRDVDEQRVALPGRLASKNRKQILVLDTKLKTGESALNTVKYLRKTYHGADVRLGVVLAYGGWEDGGVWTNLDAPAWPVVFQRDKVEIPTYVAYYTDCKPTDDRYHEAWRLRRIMAPA